MYTCAVRSEIASLSAYVPGMSIAEVRERYGLSRVIKMASNENPLGVSPLVRKVLATSLEEAFRYPQGGNPALREALARAHHVSPERIVVGNGSDEIIDMWSASSPASACIPYRPGSAGWRRVAAPFPLTTVSTSMPCFPWWMPGPVSSS